MNYPNDARFFEYQNFGKGAAINSYRPQATVSQAYYQYTVDNYLNGWIPSGYVAEPLVIYSPPYPEAPCDCVVDTHTYDTGAPIYTSVQEAIDDGNSVICIMPGNYSEQVTVNYPNVMLVGNTMSDTVISYGLVLNDWSTSHVFHVEGDIQ